jgi:pullulanase/glycogen debranching enzyme
MPDGKVWPGKPYPLGGTYDAEGTNFSLFSEAAERVELCLFDGHGTQTCVDLPEETGFCWHGYLPGIEPGQRYGFRVHGPWAPEKGCRCNPAKLLLDPYAKAVEGQVTGRKGHPRERGARHRLVHARRRRNGGGTLGGRIRQIHGRLPERRSDFQPGPSGRKGDR